ncbi:MAG: nucleotidyltransferase domain-containing protein [Bacteroidaceae bacterium]|nr:nucleotidyltransferase domain-containing protein [Bacteroidaceae bacterium]
MCDTNTIINELRRVAKDTLPESGNVILFGSRARGDAHEDSDWDVLVILDKARIEQSDYDNVSNSFTELGWELGEMIIPIMYTKKEWEEQSFTPFYKNVEREGIIIA